MKPRLLDLFCGGGGASEGYAQAGFDVVGVDVAPQRFYRHPFLLADALTVPLDGFDFIHASPPCQNYSTMKSITTRVYPSLIEPVRDRLVSSGVPYVIENVPGAPLDDPIELCGHTFGLRSYRHRLFESSLMLTEPVHVPHTVPVCGGVSRNPTALWGFGYHIVVTGNMGRQYGPQAMGIGWMWGRALGEAIPPAFTRYIGSQIIGQIR